MVNVTVRPVLVTWTPRCCPPVMGTLVTWMVFPAQVHEFGTPRATMSDPSPRSATSESSRVRLASADPHACGEAPAPAVGWLPVQGELGSGACTLSHHE